MSFAAHFWIFNAFLIEQDHCIMVAGLYVFKLIRFKREILLVDVIFMVSIVVLWLRSMM